MTHLPIKKVLAKANSLAKRRYSVTIYVPVAPNVYYDGTSYRVRVTYDYLRTSKNFHKIKDALRFRNSLNQY
jgi:hypothetical protein